MATVHERKTELHETISRLTDAVEISNRTLALTLINELTNQIVNLTGHIVTETTNEIYQRSMGNTFDADVEFGKVDAQLQGLAKNVDNLLASPLTKPWLNVGVVAIQQHILAYGVAVARNSYTHGRNAGIEAATKPTVPATAADMQVNTAPPETPVIKLTSGDLQKILTSVYTAGTPHDPSHRLFNFTSGIEHLGEIGEKIVFLRTQGTFTTLVLTGMSNGAVVHIQLND